MRTLVGLYYAAWLSLGLLVGTAPAGKVAGPSLDGAAVDCDLPGAQQCRNISSRGEGCCVQTSINHSARWQNVPALINFHEWVREKGIPGGAWPDAVDQRIPACCKDRGYPVARYLQVEGMDLDILKRSCKSGRMPAVTFSNAGNPLGRYNGSRIAHMVSLVGADVGGSHYWVILDNNFVPDALGWLSEEEFKRAYAPGWCVILLDSGPPPPPRSRPLPREVRP